MSEEEFSLLMQSCREEFKQSLPSGLDYGILMKLIDSLSDEETEIIIGLVERYKEIKASNKY